MNTFFALAALLVVAQAPAREVRPAPPPVLPGTSSIAGRVLDAADKPVEGAEVVLIQGPVRGANDTKPLIRSSRTLTKRDGLFVFQDIGAGSYRVFASYKGHLAACGSPCSIDVLAGQSRDDVTVHPSPRTIIQGRLIDHEGRPLSGLSVIALMGERELPGGVKRSDADGRFEMGVMPGPVLIAAEVIGRTGQGYSRVFYPGVLNRHEARTLTMEAGITADIELYVPEFTAATITANLSGPDGYRIDQLNLLRPDTKMRLPLSTHESVVSAINLQQGRYVVEARGTAGDQVLAAFATVDLQAFDVEVPLHLQPAGSVNGKIVLERGGLPPVDGVRVAAVWTNDGIDVKPSPDENTVGPDGVFAFTGLFGHRDFRVIGLPDDWQVTAIRAGRSDITASGLDIASGSTTELTIVVARR